MNNINSQIDGIVFEKLTSFINKQMGDYLEPIISMEVVNQIGNCIWDQLRDDVQIQIGFKIKETLSYPSINPLPSGGG